MTRKSLLRNQFWWRDSGRKKVSFHFFIKCAIQVERKISFEIAWDAGQESCFFKIISTSTIFSHPESAVHLRKKIIRRKSLLRNQFWWRDSGWKKRSFVSCVLSLFLLKQIQHLVSNIPPTLWLRRINQYPAFLLRYGYGG